MSTDVPLAAAPNAGPRRTRKLTLEEWLAEMPDDLQKNIVVRLPEELTVTVEIAQGPEHAGRRWRSLRTIGELLYLAGGALTVIMLLNQIFSG